MIDQTLPPLRTTRTSRGPFGPWCYDTWGDHGRPILLLPAIMFGRTMWWPAAAELRPHAAVIAVDLPGHGGSPGRDRYDPDDLVGELALLLHNLGVRRAPIVVGHASAAPLAMRFAAHCPVHALVTVDPPGRPEPPEPDQYVKEFDLDAVPALYRDLVAPAGGPQLLRAYAGCMRPAEPGTAPPAAIRPAHVAIHSRRPPRALGEPWRHHVYAVPGRFPHLTDVSRFVADLHRLL